MNDTYGEPVAIGVSVEDVRGAIHTLASVNGWTWRSHAFDDCVEVSLVAARGWVEVTQGTVHGGAFECWYVRPAIGEHYGDDALEQICAMWPAVRECAAQIRSRLQDMSIPDAEEIAVDAWDRLATVLRKAQPLLVEFQRRDVALALSNIVRHAGELRWAR